MLVSTKVSKNRGIFLTLEILRVSNPVLAHCDVSNDTIFKIFDGFSSAVAVQLHTIVELRAGNKFSVGSDFTKKISSELLLFQT